MNKIFLIRHGNVSRNRENRVLGCTTDPELTNEGIREVKLLADHLKSRSIFPDRIYTSQLMRTIQTAEVLRTVLGGIIERTPFLREINYGMYEGAGKEILHDIHYGYATEKMQAGNAESVSEVEERVNIILNIIACSD